MCAPAIVGLVTKFASSAIGKAVLTGLATTAAGKLMSGSQSRAAAPPPAIIPKQNTPYQRQQGPGASAALADEDIRPEDEDIKLAQNKKVRKKLERTRRGVKDLAAVQAPTDSSSMGINPVGYA